MPDLSDSASDANPIAAADQLLACLSDALQCDRLQFDENNACTVTIDDKFVVLMYLDALVTRSLILNLPLGYLPHNAQREPLLYRLMAGNYCWGLTEGGTLGLDEASDQISLCYLVPLPLAAPEQIVDIIRKLTAVGTYWMAQLAAAFADHGSAPGPAPGPAGGVFAPGMFRV